MNRMSISFTYGKRLLLVLLGALVSLASWAIPPGATELLMYEQKYVNRTIDPGKILALKNYQAKKYSPEGGEIFEVKSYWLPADKNYIFRSEEQKDSLNSAYLTRYANGRNEVLFLVHPESEDFYKSLVKNTDRGPEFEATATASSRTLMMWPAAHPEIVFFGKLSLDKEIGGVVRTLPKGEIARSVGVTQILEAAVDELPKSFSYLPEYFGVMPHGMERGGMILRSVPAKVSSGETRVMPLFAIYTRPNATTKSPIEVMLQQTRLSAEEFVLTKVLRPFANQWVDLVVNHGIAIEAHAQNVLFEISPHGLPTGNFVYRDFGGFNIDLNFRRNHLLAMPKSLPIVVNEVTDYHQEHHEKAIRQSLETYFEGGFLYGLSEELMRQGHHRLTYPFLTAMLRNEIKTQLELKGFALKGHNFYVDLLSSVKNARMQVNIKQVQCRRLF